jgi:hypothetical protein
MRSLLIGKVYNQERISTDQEMKGFSPRHLKYMRAFAEVYPDDQFVQQVLAQIA